MGPTMMSKLTKMLLVGTSLVPTLVIMAVDYFYTKSIYHWWNFGTQLFAVSALLFLIALGLMHLARRGERQLLRVCKAKNSDKQVLTFLLAYLMPILTKHDYLFHDFNCPTLVLLGIVAIAVYHSNAFDFNPMLGLLNYHFYEIEDASNFPYLLISKSPLKAAAQEIVVVQLFEYTFLAVEE